jgi:hypothetical protein
MMMPALLRTLFFQTESEIMKKKNALCPLIKVLFHHRRQMNESVKYQVSLLTTCKSSVPRPSRSYALRSGLLDIDIEHQGLQCSVSFASLDQEEIQLLVQRCVNLSAKNLNQISCEHQLDSEDFSGFLGVLFLSDIERERLKSLFLEAPNIDELHRVLNRFGHRSLSNLNEVCHLRHDLNEYQY